jgi:hypothetical protein
MRENKTLITKEFCIDKNLVFYPQTAAEAEFIQRKIFSFGYKWADNIGNRILDFNTQTSRGLVLAHGTLYYNPVDHYEGTGLLCTSAQLDKNYVPPLSLEQQVQALAAEVTALHKTIDAIYEAVSPKTLDKPASLPVDRPRRKPSP